MSYVLKLCSWYPSEVDGYNGDFVQRHAQAIATLYKVVVLYARKDASLKGTKPRLVYQQTQGVHEYLYYYPKRKIADALWSQWYYMAVLKEILPTIIATHGQPFIVHVSVLWKAARWVLYLNKKFHWPYVITEHSTEYLPDGIDNFRKKEKLRKLLTRKAFVKSNVLLPVSQRLGLAMQQLFGSKTMVVIPNVVDTQLFYPILEKNHVKIFRLVHVSTMGYQKNIEGIIRVVQRLANTPLNFELKMIGPVELPVKAALSCSKKLKEKVRFTGNIPYRQVADHLQAADGFFLFSRYENLPCVILEALCCGVPVITSNVGGISTVVNEHNGVLIPSENEDALFQALTELITRKKVYDNNAIAQLAQQKFSYSTVAVQFSKAYEMALGTNLSRFQKK